MASVAGRLSAGDVTIRKGSTTLAILKPDKLNHYSMDSDSTKLPLTWNTGDTLSISASGAEIEAFSMSVTAPAMPESVTPALSRTADNPTPVSMSADLQVGWTAGSNPFVSVSVSQNLNGDYRAINCTFPDTGTGTIPKDLLAQMFNAEANLLVSRTLKVTAEAGDKSIYGFASAFVDGGIRLQP